MVGANVKAETLALMEVKSSLEEQMDSIIARITAPNAPGLSGNLLDPQGFPRADIDIPAVRADRHRLSVLRMDYKAITEKIESNLHILHSVGHVRDSSLPQKRSAEGEDVRQLWISVRISASEASTPSFVPEGPISMEEDSVMRLPFAIFDEVTEGSPAALDGIAVGDQLLKFGSVEGGDNALPRLAREGQINQDCPMPVMVIRHGVQVELTVTPRSWSGHGLLGCHIQPL